MKGPAPRSFRDHPCWLLSLLGLLAWHGWLTLSLFGPGPSLEGLVDDRPILSGRHALHLYHGFLGARALHERGSPACYDPSFHAGYPKTPVFDGGSRPAELALYLGGGSFNPAAYKLGIALVCALAPLSFWVTARAAGLARADAGLAMLLGMLIWWGGPCRELLEAGDVDLLLAAILLLAQAGLLVRYHRQPGPAGLLGVCACALLGWFAHPLLFALAFPLFLIYYISVGPRHQMTWHVALLGGLITAIAVNAFWLCDWVAYWWIRLPPAPDSGLAPGWNLQAFWKAPLWGGAADRVLGALLLTAGSVGVVMHNVSGERATARLFGLGMLGLLGLAAAGLAFEPMGRLGAAQLLAPALFLAVPPTAYALAEAARRLPAHPIAVGMGFLSVAGLAAAAGWASPSGERPAWQEPRPFQIGLGPERSALVESLKRHTTPQARILWEDRRAPHTASQWTPLLPLLTDRAFVGGLDPDAGIEHTAWGLADQTLAGRPLDDWTDRELSDYCDRYNIGWVVGWSPRARQRFDEWSTRGFAESTTPLSDRDGVRGEGMLYTVRRKHSFAQVGRVGWMNADARRIVLNEVEPENGVIVLSLHYQAGMRVSPSRVRLVDPPRDHPGSGAEGAGFCSDSIPWVKLKVDEFVPRITITWDRR